MNMKKRSAFGLVAQILLLLNAASTVFAGPPTGESAKATVEEERALQGMNGRIKGKIAWSSSREGNHRIFVMNCDGSDAHRVTQTSHTDWFSRFSPDGKQILYCRSKLDWSMESEVDHNKMWDTWIINANGTGERLLIKDATWATWTKDGTGIIFSRGTQVFSFGVATQAETLLCDSEKDGLDGAILQNPNLSPDGKSLAITLRGKKRETGILSLADKKWEKVGEGCQLSWFPDGARLVTVNPTGNGGSEIYCYRLKDVLGNSNPSEKELRFMDLPGRRSHEYFPKISSDGKWMVWAATQRGHDHDMADYEIYLWEVGTPQEGAVRLTFHTGNDRWPDIFVEKE